MTAEEFYQEAFSNPKIGDDITDLMDAYAKHRAIEFGQEIIDHLCYGAQSKEWIEEKYNEVYGEDKSES